MNATCTLSERDLAERLDWIRSEILPYARRSERLAHGFAWELEDAPGLAEKLDRLIALERQCCGGLELARTEGAQPGRLRLEVRGIGAEALPILAASYAPGLYTPDGAVRDSRAQSRPQVAGAPSSVYHHDAMRGLLADDEGPPEEESFVDARSRFAPTVLLCAALLALSLVPRGLVLCVGDAHVEIEGGCALAPCDTPDEAASRVLGMSPPDRCTDTPLLLPSLRKSEHEVGVAVTLAASVTPGVLHAATRTSLAPRKPARALDGDSRPLVLRL